MYGLPMTTSNDEPADPTATDDEADEGVDDGTGVDPEHDDQDSEATSTAPPEGNPTMPFE